MKITQITAFCLLYFFSSISPSHADRFPESLVKRTIFSATSDTSKVFRAYMLKAKSARMLGLLYIPDYLARRSFGFEKLGLKPNINPEFREALDGPMFTADFRTAARKLDFSVACIGIDDLEYHVIQLFLHLEIIILDAIISERAPSKRISKIFVNDVASSNIDETCERMENVEAKSSKIDWNIALPSFLSSLGPDGVPPKIEPLQRYWTIENSKNRIFQRRLYEDKEGFTPCAVIRNQYTFYYDIDTPIFEGLINKWSFDAAISRVRDSNVVIVEAHTDSGGPAWRNYQLAKERGNSVVKKLIEKGIYKENIFLFVLGAHCPQVSMGNDRYVRANRRVILRTIR